MIRIGIIIGSTRPNRVGEVVAKWVHDIAGKRKDAWFELVDLKDYNLPLLDEPLPASQGNYTMEHTKKWSAAISALDAFVFVTPEYNHGTCAALKNALDFLYEEWNNKACGFVSYGGAGGSRAVEQLRQTMAQLQIADVRAQVMLSTFTDFENQKEFKPAERHEKTVNKMLDQVISWGTAMATVRKK
jgi:NAD(P)H-dependent FMN reductase